MIEVEFDSMQKTKILEQIIQERKVNIFKIELDLRFGKRQVLKASGDEAIRITNMINQWQKMRDGEKAYLEFLYEVMREEGKKIPSA